MPGVVPFPPPPPEGQEREGPEEKKARAGEEEPSELPPFVLQGGGELERKMGKEPRRRSC